MVWCFLTTSVPVYMEEIIVPINTMNASTSVWLSLTAATQQPQGQPGASQDLQAQWAEYYRQLGYAYYGQGGAAGGQPGQSPGGATGGSGGEQKVLYLRKFTLSMHAVIMVTVTVFRVKMFIPFL